jgi:hypothetical protein
LLDRKKRKGGYNPSISLLNKSLTFCNFVIIIIQQNLKCNPRRIGKIRKQKHEIIIIDKSDEGYIWNKISIP